jgi:uncharacterized membrane protein YccF (DUF307 family)
MFHILPLWVKKETVREPKKRKDDNNMKKTAKLLMVVFILEFAAFWLFVEHMEAAIG